MESLDADEMLVQSCDREGVEIIKCTTQHNMAEMRCFDGEPFEERLEIEKYSFTLMDTDLYGKLDVARRYGEGLISMSVREFQMTTALSCDDVKDSNRMSYHALIVSAPFNPVRHINDPRHLEGDSTTFMPPQA